MKVKKCFGLAMLVCFISGCGKTSNATGSASLQEKNEFVVDFNKSNGVGGSDSVVVTYGQSMPSAIAPTRDDCTFRGYYSFEDDGVRQYYDSNMNSVRNWDKKSDITLKALWIYSKVDVIEGGLLFVLINNSNEYEVYAESSSVVEITIPASVKDKPVTRIASYAFIACYNLTTITVANSVTSISEYAFTSCNNLTTINIDSNNATYKSIDGDVYSKDGREFVMVALGKTSITIPSSVTSIGTSAFRECRGLTSITIPNSVTTIETWAFSNCNNLTSIVIPSSVTRIGQGAFSYCINLTSIIISNGITAIDLGIFNGCSNLTSILIPSSVTLIGESTFSYCDNLKTINVDNNNVTYKSIDGNIYSKDGREFVMAAPGKTSVLISSSVTEIRGNAFKYCRGLTLVTIPSNVTEVTYDIFSECSSLKAINIDSKNAIYKSIDGNVYSKDGREFAIAAPGKTSITVPSSVTEIKGNAFNDCGNLTTVIFEKKSQLTTIGRWAFSGCDGLTSISIPNSVATIGYGAFSGCNNLTTIFVKGHKSKPTGWNDYWNYDCSAEVVWNA